MTTSLDKDKTSQSQDMVWVSKDKLEVLRAQARSAAAKNMPLTNAITDITQQIRIVHCVSSQYFFGGDTIYEDDTRESLFASVSMLREKLSQFEKNFNLHDITINEDWGKFIDTSKLSGTTGP